MFNSNLFNLDQFWKYTNTNKFTMKTYFLKLLKLIWWCRCITCNREGVVSLWLVSLYTLTFVFFILEWNLNACLAGVPCMQANETIKTEESFISQWRTQDLTKTRAKSWWPNPSGQNPKAATYSIVYRTIYIHTYITEKNSQAKFTNLKKFLNYIINSTIQ